MTFPVEARSDRIGIVLALFPSDGSLATEIERAPDASGSPDTGNSEQLAIVEPGTRTFTDIRSGGIWWYRSRHVRPGATPSDWTEWVGASPIQIPPELPTEFGEPGVREVTGSFDGSGDLTLNIQCLPGTGSVKVAFSTSAHPDKATVRAETADDTDSENYVEVALSTGAMVGETVFVSILTYEFGSAGGRESSFRHRASFLRQSTGSQVSTIRPNADVAAGGWQNSTAADLWRDVDDNPRDDSTYIFDDDGTGTAKLGLTDPGGAPTTATLRFASQLSVQEVITGDSDLALYDGSTSTRLGGAEMNTTQDFVETVVSGIDISGVDPADLEIWIVPDSSTGTSASQHQVSWIQVDLS